MITYKIINKFFISLITLFLRQKNLLILLWYTYPLHILITYLRYHEIDEVFPTYYSAYGLFSIPYKY